MRLLLVQHGDSVPESVDPAKPLSEAGRRDVTSLARACLAAGIQAHEILHSGKLRARQSAEIIGEALSIPCRPCAGLDPLDPVRPFAEGCAEWEESRIIVGHLPFLERLAAWLVAQREEPPVVVFQRGGMVCLEKRAPTEWRILWTFFPQQPHKGS